MVEILGTITDEWLRTVGTEVDRAGEAGEFVEGAFALVYHYFLGDEVLASGKTLLEEIRQTMQVGSKARCWSSGQIKESLNTDEPHYGDGAYVTFHSDLANAHLEVRRNHGMSVSVRRYRALLRIIDISRFNRIPRTCGVGLADPMCKFVEGDVIFIGPDEMEILEIQRLVNEEWETC